MPGLRKDRTFPATCAVFDPEANEYTCSGGKKLKKYWRNMCKARNGLCKDNSYRNYARKADCSGDPSFDSKKENMV